MTTTGLAALFAVLALGFVEGFGRFYPSKRTWLRLRSRHGRRAVRAMRERFESAAQAKAGRKVGTFLLGLAIVWIAASPLLDKRWYEVVLDILPYIFVLIAILRMPTVMKKVAARMKEFERSIGEDPDAEFDDGGATAIAL
jgi:hypothetical protein